MFFTNSRGLASVAWDRYLAEFDYRYTTRKMGDTARMERLMGQVGGKRLTYKLVKA